MEPAVLPSDLLVVVLAVPCSCLPVQQALLADQAVHWSMHRQLAVHLAMLVLLDQLVVLEVLFVLHLDQLQEVLFALDRPRNLLP
jgi:hypothetical protein